MNHQLSQPYPRTFSADAMGLSRTKFCGYLFLLIVIQLIQLVRCDSAGCGSLVTYRQYTVLLDQAPQCYRHGCGAGNASLTTISSSYSSDAPCYSLWKIISNRFHSDWCESCPQRDVACRLQGWPILNTTSMCQFVPNDWIFYTDGVCCNSGTEPFEIAKWIGRMCDETWRDPFKFYGGMAKEDWEEWVQPWNWTVRPLNSTNQPDPQAQCSGASSYLWHFAIDIILNLIEVVAEASVKYWLYKLRNKTPKKKNLFSKLFCIPNKERESLQAKLWNRLPFAKRLDLDLDLIQWFFVGIMHAVSIIVSTYWWAAIVHNTVGYQHVPIVRLTLLYTARPRMPWMACLLILISHEAFVNAALSVALAEWILQLVGLYVFFSTTNTGRLRDFYRHNQLEPYWRGFDAHVMYSGTMFWAGVAGYFLWALLVFLALGFGVLKFSKIIKPARQQAEKEAEKAAIDNLPPWMRKWSRKRIVQFRKSLPKIPVHQLPPRLRQWEQQKRKQFVTVVEEINEWFYVSERRQASGQPYSQVQQDDFTHFEPVGRRTASTQRLLVDRSNLGRFRRHRDGYKIALAVAFAMGMCTFAAQWMFWDGFVKSSGDR